MEQCQKLLKQEGTARRIECMLLLHALNPTSQCLLVSTVFGIVPSLPTFIFNPQRACAARVTVLDAWPSSEKMASVSGAV